MRVLQIVPEFEEGGVERHVLHLAQELKTLGHDVALATAGGKLEASLPDSIPLIRLPVQRKNPLTGLRCALYLAAHSKNWDLLHAHSRVPAWIAWMASSLSGIPWVVTAHALYSLNFGVTPLAHASGVICISSAVEEHLSGRLPSRTAVIPNGLPPASVRWGGEGFPQNPRFLFVGRLTRIKGLETVLKALGALTDREWTLDVLGDGGQREEWEALSKALGLEARVVFHGFRDDAAAWMARAGCLLLPSFSEGMSLVVLEALNIGLPVLASSLPPLLPLTAGPLLPPGDVEAWRKAIVTVLDGGSASPFVPRNIPTTAEMARATAEFYGQVIRP